MIRKIRKDLEQVRAKKLHKFEDLNPLIERCIRHYKSLFPQMTITKRGSKTVYHFNVPGVNPISIVEATRLSRLDSQVLCEADSIGD